MTTPKDHSHLQTQKPTFKRQFYETLKFIVQVGCIVLFIRVLILQPFQIPSGSMIPNLLIGDYLMVSKFSYGYGKYSFPLGLIDFDGRLLFDSRPNRGDVVVFRKPSEPDIDYIKRVVGIPGDRIQMFDGHLYVNDHRLKRVQTADFVLEAESGTSNRLVLQYEEWFKDHQKPHRIIEVYGDKGPRDDTRIYHVPDRHYFMMGDNRDSSLDSRELSEVGFVPEENLIGRAEFLFFSLKPQHKWWKIWELPFAVRWSRITQMIE
ncbi:MAG: signal peptidase I [Pseudomonadota bacterium]